MALATYAGICGSVLGFDKEDLDIQKKRRAFFQKGNYAIGVTEALLGEDPKGRGDSVFVYHVSDTAYDCIYSCYMPAPMVVDQTDERIVLSSKSKSFNADRTSAITISAGEVTAVEHYDFPEDAGGFPLMSVWLSTARFLDADIYHVQGNGISRMTFNGRSASVENVEEAFDEKEIREMFSPQGEFVPNWLMRTEEGLRVLWQIGLDTEGVGATYAPDARLFAPGPGGGKARFFNNVNGLTKGGKAHFEIKLRVAPEEDFPREIQPAEAITLFDTHVHITARTDLRDSALMARKVGYRYGLLSILLDEKGGGRLFLGNEHMFAFMKRYPDVVYGHGLFEMCDAGYPGFWKRKATTVQEIEELRRKGCRGIKSLEKWTSVKVDDPQYDEHYRKMAELGMPIVFHSIGVDDQRGHSNTRVANVARKFPKLNVLMAHSQNSMEELELVTKALKELPNLYWQHMHILSRHGKIKGTEKLAFEYLLEAGVAHKVVYGSDVQTDHDVMPGLRAETLKMLKDLNVPQETIDDIMWRNNERLYATLKPVP